MFTLLRLHMEKVVIVGLLLYVAWDKGAWVKSIYDAQTTFRPFMESEAIVIIAVAIAVIVAYPIVKDYLNSKPNRKS